MKLKTGDKVIVRTGADKGKTGKITKVMPKKDMVLVEGVNVRTKHIKPSRENPQGGIKKDSQPIAVNKVGIVSPKSDKKASRISYKVDKAGKKTRIYQSSGKEI